MEKATVRHTDPRNSKRNRPHKPHGPWEQASRESNGLFARYAEVIAAKYPMLTSMELRVCALVKALMPSWRIAEILCIEERTVENHRTKARRKMKIRHGKSLTRYLAML